MLFWLTSMIASVQLSAVVIVRFSRWTAPSPRNPDDPYGALHFTGTQSYAKVFDGRGLNAFPLTVMVWIRTDRSTAALDQTRRFHAACAFASMVQIQGQKQNIVLSLK